jgi:hypothetical protein
MLHRILLLCLSGGVFAAGPDEYNVDNWEENVGWKNNIDCFFGFIDEGEVGCILLEEEDDGLQALSGCHLSVVFFQTAPACRAPTHRFVIEGREDATKVCTYEGYEDAPLDCKETRLVTQFHPFGFNKFAGTVQVSGKCGFLPSIYRVLISLSVRHHTFPSFLLVGLPLTRMNLCFLQAVSPG